jgi:hypothetical protein
VVPAGLKDTFNATPPERDAGIAPLVARVTDPEVPKLIEAIYKVPAPPTPRTDLVEIFLTGLTTKGDGPIKVDLNSQLNNADVNPARFRPSEQLRLNLGVPVSANPERLGLLAGDQQGFPNGRRLTDDVVDIELQALEGAAATGKLVDALAAGDKVDANDQQFGKAFPYVALPNGTAVNGGGSGGAGGGAAADPSASPSDPAGSPRPAGFAGRASTPMAVAIVVIGLVGLVGLVTVFVLPWFTRRRRRGTTARQQQV